MATKTFSAGEVLTASDTNTYLNNGGLVFISKTSWTSGTNVTINGCFSATYDSYRVVLRNAKHATTSSNLVLRFLNGATEYATNYYWSRRYITFNAGGGDVNSGAGAATDIVMGIVASTANAGAGVLDVFDPFKAAITTVNFQGIWAITTGESSVGTGFLNNTNSCDGMRFYASSGNLTGLDVYVYGYRQP
jgi:hypothetical protein